MCYIKAPKIPRDFAYGEQAKEDEQLSDLKVYGAHTLPTLPKALSSTLEAVIKLHNSSFAHPQITTFESHVQHSFPTHDMYKELHRKQTGYFLYGPRRKKHLSLARPRFLRYTLTIKRPVGRSFVNLKGGSTAARSTDRPNRKHRKAFGEHRTSISTRRLSESCAQRRAEIARTA